MGEQQSNEPVWSWPERPPIGGGLPRPSVPLPPRQATFSREPQPTGESPSTDMVDESSPDGQPGSGTQVMALRSSIITLATTLVSTLAAFGLDLDEAQSTALVSTITALTMLVVLVLGMKRQRRG